MSVAAGPVREFAPAKINLFLHVVGRRADGYHLISSLMVFAGVGDTIEARPGVGLALAIDGPFAPVLTADQDNLVTRAAARLAELLAIPPDAAIRLTKRLPVASGIGGGSADAAAAIRALVRLWGRQPEPAALARLALGLGADVPVCLAGRAAQVSGIGEVLDPIPSLPPAWLVLVNPGVALPTRDVFAARGGPFSPPAPLAVLPRDAAGLAAELCLRHNDLAAPAVRIAPVIGEVIAALESFPDCLLARMSGSGATCFGLFADPRAADGAAAAIRKSRPGWWCAAAAIRS